MGKREKHSLAVPVEFSFILVTVTPFPILILNHSSSLFNSMQLLGYICYCETQSLSFFVAILLCWFLIHKEIHLTIDMTECNVRRQLERTQSKPRFLGLQEGQTVCSVNLQVMDKFLNFTTAERGVKNKLWLVTWMTVEGSCTLVGNRQHK